MLLCSLQRVNREQRRSRSINQLIAEHSGHEGLCQLHRKLTTYIQRLKLYIIICDQLYPVLHALICNIYYKYLNTEQCHIKTRWHCCSIYPRDWIEYDLPRTVHTGNRKYLFKQSILQQPHMSRCSLGPRPGAWHFPYHASTR